MEEICKYFVFCLDKQRYAIKLTSVEKVVRVVELISVPENINYLIGLINLEGRILPVFDIRKRFGIQPREVDLEDRVIISTTQHGVIAVIVDSVEGIVDIASNQISEAKTIYPNMESYIEGVWKTAESTVLIYNADNLFPIFNKKTLDNIIVNTNPIS